ncbi:protein STRUBBELIG-RECEPTOR FAMILY 3-like isoform X1 [Zingiber officinale]|uniref:protein STRUBBELIG-RECEPTOR FAMILY 3-like isoform X1 n=1 Tax=Zingiber officinale TaxID=94328 RepID=UPI001C4CD4FD|nr:protein STRUBBELIG-RECEPTOR FAMILY 3-like isoform X1 [Zingiber officinale]XP_042474361.1 protein STRUBBELIG-RECEPTOR FAMILY 3-like isoform X1 [Zingiber officinale]XP_042474362.1 protein STRUBBELIG-RECEPTOR FAMILY 3-like isoform X1 [Zingiber officinale]XP_042474363.1 protein STRUBBELIG-RECEPTOR FAMILY 3-like isoform X1 [Zingiber officinale]XP_042474364.1 protein STRUBBELIG-RECEPTOR FAMILY 3-like isoform X1 [Zingiber officinale]
MGLRVLFGMTLLLALSLLLYMPTCRGYTNGQDVFAINSLYFTLDFPPLPGWGAFGGDPCGEGWQGVECVDSSITAIVLNGANLAGQLGDELSYFTSLITLDLSDNHISGSIPGSLPVTLRRFFLSDNQFTGSIPGSLSNLTLLSDMSLNNNMLSAELPDAFRALTGLINLDISHNNLSGQLPPSMKGLSSLTTLHIQNNRISGILDVLQDLPLQDLNVENNLFSGSIPPKLLNVPNFKKNGNLFDANVIPPVMAPPMVSPFPQPPNVAMAPFPSSEAPIQSGGQFSRHSKISTAELVGYSCMAVVVLVIIIAIVKLCISKCKTRKPKDGATCKWHDASRIGQPKDAQISSEFIRSHKEGAFRKPIRRPEYNSNGRSNVSLPMPPVTRFDTEKLGIIGEKSLRNRTETSTPISARWFHVATLQQYTNSFSEDNLIQDGRFGRLYLAELPQGKMLAVLKLENRDSNPSEDNFLKIVERISRVQHPNIVNLVGYSDGYGQRLLVYNYFNCTTLYEMLHSNDSIKKKLSWNARIKIAIGAAKALEYLHDGCQPPLVHQRFDSGNILINDDLEVRVSECGLASLLSLFPATQLSGMEPAFFSYDAPEVSESGSYSVQSDVYSFGIVMLELLTGHKSFDSSRPWGEQHLVRWASSQLYDMNALTKMVDPSVGGQFVVKSISRFADIISRCIQEVPEFRPPMSEVVQDLASVI